MPEPTRSSPAEDTGPYGGDIAKAAQHVGIPTGVSQVLDTIGNLAGIAANVFGAFQAGVAVLQLFGVGSPDPDQQYFLQIEDQLSQIQTQLGQLEQKLDQVFATLEGEVLGAANQNVRIQCSNAVSDSRAAAADALSYVKNPQDALQIAGLENALSLSLSALQRLTPEALWQQVNSTRSFYGDPWNGMIAPPEANSGASTIFDYRYALPAYLEAVINRIIVVSAADQSYRDRLRTEVKQHADLMIQLHDKIVSGFARLKLPSIPELQDVIAALNLNFYLSGSEYWQKLPSSPGWLTNARVYGAVDGYTGNAVTISFSQLQLFGLNCASELKNNLNPNLDTFDVADQAMRLRYKLDLASRFLGVKLYATSGLSRLWNTVVQFYGMLGLPAPSMNPALVSFTQLSMREAEDLCPNPQARTLRTLGAAQTLLEITLVDAGHVSVLTSPAIQSLCALFAPPGAFVPKPPNIAFYTGTEPA